MTTSRRIVDILIQSPEGNPIAVVEVKNLRNLSGDEAIQLRRNLADYGVPIQVPFFMLLLYTFPMDNVVARYSDRKAGERLYEAEFEILALRWLNHLTVKSQNSGEEPEKTLALSGFDAAIKEADVLLEAEV